MPLPLALLLAVLHALAASLPVRLPDAAGRRLAVEQTVGGASLHRAERPPVHRALDAARPFAGIVATRGDAPTVHVPPAAVSAAPPRPSCEAMLALGARARALAASHAVAARGAVLPYFPTAPPLQG